MTSAYLYYALALETAIWLGLAVVSGGMMMKSARYPWPSPHPKLVFVISSIMLTLGILKGAWLAWHGV